MPECPRGLCSAPRQKIFFIFKSCSKVVHFAPESVVHITPEIFVHYSPEYSATYAFLGDKEKAYQNLSEFSKLNFFPKWWITLIKYDPLFDNIKSEERFKKIIQNMETKYQVEHERVRKWLEGQGML